MTKIERVREEERLGERLGAVVRDREGEMEREGKRDGWKKERRYAYLLPRSFRPMRHDTHLQKQKIICHDQL